MEEKNLLILDLDETLIFATEEVLDRSADFSFHHYHVYLRPYVREFLTICAQHFRLAVWTSSTEAYAQKIVEFLFAEDQNLEFVWARSRCTMVYDATWQDYEWVKDLKKLKRRGYDLDRVLMVDDTPRKLQRNYGNLVRINMFEGDPADQELRQLAPYLVALAQHQKLRTLEKRDWKSSVENS